MIQLSVSPLRGSRVLIWLGPCAASLVLIGWGDQIVFDWLSWCADNTIIITFNQFVWIIIRLLKECNRSFVSYLAFAFVCWVRVQSCRSCDKNESCVNVSLSFFVVIERKLTIFISLETAWSCVSNDIKLVKYRRKTTKIDKEVQMHLFVLLWLSKVVKQRGCQDYD